MDIRRFTDQKTGSLVKVPVGEIEDWAFVPDPLPPRWEFPARLWPLLDKATTTLGELNGIGATLANPMLLLRPLQQREALRSSSLEGTFASPEEVLLFEMRPREPKSVNDRANAWLEVSNYSHALREGTSYLANGGEISIGFICQLHKWLMEGVRGKDRSPGVIRDRQVQIGGDRRFIPPPVVSLGPCLEALESRFAAKEKRFHQLVRCYMIHYQFEAIHPFRDGNGRVGRLLLALMTCQWCNLSLPWLYLSAFFESHKDEYIDRLFNISSEGDWEAWIKFCLIGTVEQAGDAIIRCNQLRKLNVEFQQQIANGPGRLRSIVDDLFSSPVLTIPEAERKYGVTYPTAQSDVERLVKLGIMRQLEDIKPRTFFCPAIFKIAYRDAPSDVPDL